jgi:hypothetical protein
MSLIDSPLIEQHRDHRLSIGRYLIIAAWIVEIFAILIGLFISFAMGLSAYEESRSSGLVEASQGSSWALWLNVLISITPFFMVALVEGTKIPFVQAFYNTTSGVWKLIFGMVLIFLAFITFESALNGFERNFTNLTYVIDNEKKNLVLVEEQIDRLNSRIENASKGNLAEIETEYNERIDVISRERDSQTVLIQERIQALRATIQSEYIKGLREQAQKLNAQVERVRIDREKQITTLRQSSVANLEKTETEIGVRRRQLQTKIDRLTQDIRNNERRREAELSDAGIFTNKEEIRQRWNRASAPLEKQREETQNSLEDLSIPTIVAQSNDTLNVSINTLRAGYEKILDKLDQELSDLNNEIAGSLGAREQDIEQSITGYLLEIGTVENRYQSQQGDAAKLRDTALLKLANSQQIISETGVEKDLLDGERIQIRDTINRKVGNNQIYRIAQWAFGAESAADLDRTDVLKVALVWFGSLAALVAFTGIFLALASEVIRDFNRQPLSDIFKNRVASGGKFLNSLRRLVSYWRRVRRAPRTIEVAREVYVDKIVEKTVTKEVPIKHLVYVPFYTADKAEVSIQGAGSIKDSDSVVPDMEGS